MQFMHRDDVHLTPISLDMIEPKLYLGSLAAARDIPTLAKYEISHILTIDVVPLPRKIVDLPHITTKFLQAFDTPNEDILRYFDDAHQFITEAVLNGGGVLVHCYFGVSRSASLVLAHVMRKHELSYKEAFDKVKLKRKIIQPNDGFINQLILYHEMGYKPDLNNMKFKKFRLNTAAQQVKKVHILPQSFMDLVKSDPGLTQTQPEPNVYRCRKCRRVLASESNLITHRIGGETCTKTYFLEPLAWMNATHVEQEKLYCPNCKSKVGSFSWVMGCLCPCGVKVAPAFYLTPSKVDFSNVVKNVEMTL